MNSPFKHISSAFDVFFDETITVKTTDGKRDTFEVSIFNNGDADPLSDDMMDSKMNVIDFLFKKKDWSFVSRLERGAEIQRLNSQKKYSVSEAKYDDALGWIVTAREV